MTDENFKAYFERTTGKPFEGVAGGLISDHMRLMMDTMAEYVDAKVAEMQSKLKEGRND